MPITRRKFLWSAAGTTAAFLALTAEGRREANHPQLDRVEIFLPQLPDVFDGYTIAQLTDFHYDPIFTHIPIAEGVRMVNALRPNLIVLTGDFATAPLMGGLHRSVKVPGLEACAELLRDLQAENGVFGVLGNHDEYYSHTRMIGALKAVEIRILRNEAIPIERQQRRLWLAGISDIVSGEPDLNRTLHAIPAGETTALLCHEPDFADTAAKYPVDIQLSGHSHGGQVVLPLAGAMYLPILARKYPRGLRHLGKLTLYTSRGIGTVRVPVRLHCPPEVTLITLRAGPRPPVAGARKSADPGTA